MDLKCKKCSGRLVLTSYSFYQEKEMIVTTLGFDCTGCPAKHNLELIGSTKHLYYVEGENDDGT